MQPRLGCTHTHYIFNQNGSTLKLTHLIRMEYTNLFSWISPLPVLVNIITVQNLCAFVKTDSFPNISPHSAELKNNTKNNKKKHFNHWGYSVSMTLCAWWLNLAFYLIVVTLKLVTLQKVQETKLSFISLEIRIPYYINVLFRYI